MKIVKIVVGIVIVLAAIVIYLSIHFTRDSLDHYNAGVGFDKSHETDKAIAEYRESD